MFQKIEKNNSENISINKRWVNQFEAKILNELSKIKNNSNIINDDKIKNRSDSNSEDSDSEINLSTFLNETVFNAKSNSNKQESKINNQ